jgi:glycosyltransferase involved in cell wall biosynthesis
MKIVSFVEGVRKAGGVTGISGVPYILNSLAERGHSVLLGIGGRPMPTVRRFQNTKANKYYFEHGNHFMETVCFPAWTHWRFAPSMINFKSAVFKADIVTLHSLYSFPVLTGYLLARLYRKPYIIWPHGVLAPFQREVGKKKKAIYDKLFSRRILNNASAIIYSFSGERDEVSHLNLVSPTVIISEGIDLTEYAPIGRTNQFRSKYFKGDNNFLILFLGRLNLKKGLDILIKATRIVSERYPGIHLAIVGPADPPAFAKKVSQWIKECNLQNNIIVTGYLESLEEKKQAFADADVFVLVSQAENFGNTIFEAMASHVPVIISDTLNVVDEIRKGEAGVVVPRDPEELAQAIIRLIEDPSLSKRLVDNGYRLAKKFSWEIYGKKLEQTIKCILQGSPFPIDLMPA